MKTKKIKNNNREYLPTKVIQRLDKLNNNHQLQYKTKNNYILAAALIHFHYLNSYYDYVPLSGKYWKKVFGGDYKSKVLQPLIDASIIESNQFFYIDYSKKNNDKIIFVWYRINPLLMNDEFDYIDYYQAARGSDAVKSILVKKSHLDSLSIHINEESTFKYIDEEAETICRNFLKEVDVTPNICDVKIEYKICKANQPSKPRYALIKNVGSRDDEKNLKFIKYRNDYYLVDDIDDFLLFKIKRFKNDNKYLIKKINNGCFNDKRSNANLRLNNELVNFPTKLLQFVTINCSSCIQIDLRTSQFLLLANMLNLIKNDDYDALLTFFKYDKTKEYIREFILIVKSKKIKNHPDVQLFIDDVFYTDFYAITQEYLGLSSRDFTKNLLFKLIFAKSISNDSLMSKFNERYPTVVNILKEFKSLKSNSKKEVPEEEQDDKSNLAVFLQCVEAEIFIDNILIPLREKDIPCFSRHDSIVVEQSYYFEVKDFMVNVFNKLGFKYNSKKDDYFAYIYSDELIEDYDIDDDNDTNYGCDIFNNYEIIDDNNTYNNASILINNSSYYTSINMDQGEATGDLLGGCLSEDEHIHDNQIIVHCRQDFDYSEDILSDYIFIDEGIEEFPYLDEIPIKNIYSEIKDKEVLVYNSNQFDYNEWVINEGVINDLINSPD